MIEQILETIDGIIGDVVLIKTTVDITKTDTTTQLKDIIFPYIDATGDTITNAKQWEISRGQQSNYETLIQTINLKATPIYYSIPENNDYYWTMFFVVEHNELFISPKSNGLYDGLIQDFNNVPITINLTEKEQFKINVWNVDNIWITQYNTNHK